MSIISKVVLFKWSVYCKYCVVGGYSYVQKSLKRELSYYVKDGVTDKTSFYYGKLIKLYNQYQLNVIN